MEKCLSSTPVKNEKIFIERVGAHLRCVNNHYAKFEYKGMKILQQRLAAT